MISNAGPARPGHDDPVPLDDVMPPHRLYAGGIARGGHGWYRKPGR
jgi:hypothetical protein